MIELTQTGKRYQTGPTGVSALTDVSLTIHANEFVAIMGPSGSGKSTLLHILGFLDRPDTGSYKIFGREVTRLKDHQLALFRNHLVGFVFQQFHLLPRNTALENAELPLAYAGKRHLRETAQAKIDEVGLKDRAGHRPNELSGGEQQRVAIARSLVNDPPIILADEPTGNLDSKSAQEIMGILKRLHQTGKTIIVVTHERDIAEQAQRIITMRDGRIVADESRTKTKPQAADAVPADFETILSDRHTTVSKAEFIDHLRQAVFAITAHKLRSFLSMLGILIGVGAVIAMLALGEGAKESIRERLASLGSNLLVVRPGSSHQRGVVLEAGTVTRFTFSDTDAMAQLPEVKLVSPSARGSAQVVYGNKNWHTRIQGEGVNYPLVRSAQPQVGRYFTAEEIAMRKKVAVIGMTLVDELFGDKNPIGENIKINRINFRVIGILPEKGQSPWRDRDDVLVVPITTAMYRVLGSKYVDSIDVEVQDENLMKQAEDAIAALIMKRHRLSEDKRNTFQIRNLTEIRDALEGTTKTMGLLLGCIAAISLLVGGIGIMNIMLVSVTERTREIGLRKALGASARDIRLQFLIESAVMTLSGGLLGILLGVGSAVMLSVFAGWTVKTSLFAVLLAFGFSIAVGVLFGLLPANKAAKLNPIEALRYE